MQHIIEVDYYATDGRVLAFEHPFEKDERTWRRHQCPAADHVAELVDLHEFVLEKDGVEYVVEGPDRSMMGYCPACVEEKRRRVPEHRDRGDLEIVAAELAEHRDWLDVKIAFEPAYIEDAGGLAFCPFCADKLETVVERHGRMACPTHGALAIDVKQLDAEATHAD